MKNVHHMFEASKEEIFPGAQESWSVEGVHLLLTISAPDATAMKVNRSTIS